MADIFDEQKRSEIMAGVRTAGTDIEEALGECVKKFWPKHRYRKNVTKLLGKPDIVFPKKKVAIFADGDFQHGKNFERWRDEVPEFRQKKIRGNIERDKKQKRELEEMGYRVLRFWGSELKKEKEEIIRKITNTLD